jgi:hypothetical protein
MGAGTISEFRTKSPGVLAAGYAFMAICTVCVGLRFFTRWFTRVGLKADDWCLFFGYILFLVTSGLLTKGRLYSPMIEIEDALTRR